MVFGEADIIKAVALQSGVTTVGEGGVDLMSVEAIQTRTLCFSMVPISILRIY